MNSVPAQSAQSPQSLQSPHSQTAAVSNPPDSPTPASSSHQRRIPRLFSLNRQRNPTTSSHPTPILVRTHPRPAPRRPQPGPSRRMEPPPLPPPSAFAFDSIFSSIESQIQDPLTAISEICARSRYSLSNEYGAHLPPLGEIRGRGGLWIRTETLSTVAEGSSASGSGSETGTMRSAYGSLRAWERRARWDVRGEGVLLGGEVRPVRGVSEGVVDEERQDEQEDVRKAPESGTFSFLGGFGSLNWLWKKKEDKAKDAESSLRNLLPSTAGVG